MRTFITSQPWRSRKPRDYISSADDGTIFGPFSAHEPYIGGKIDCYLDLNSIYAYFAFVHLRESAEKLAFYDARVDFHPVYLPELQRRSGNRVIWTVKARQDWLEQYELPRSKRDFGLSEAEPPEGNMNNLFGIGQTPLPLQALLVIKQSYSHGVFVSAINWLYQCFWTPPQQHIKDEGPLRKALLEMPANFVGKRQAHEPEQFSAAEVDAILQKAVEKETQDELRKNTDDALEQGGFGAPWMMVRNAKGETEPFFGSDRFAQVYGFLGLPFRPLELLSREDSVKSNL